MSDKNTRETSIEDFLISEVVRRGGVCLKLEVKNQRGWPDRLCLMPLGITLLAELKRPVGGAVSMHQRAKVAKLRELDHTVGVLKNKEEVRRFLKNNYDCKAHGTEHMCEGRL